ncbi:RNA polymerase sigma factor [Mucilaginibacter myungsuensis]|uniref:Sigma-70 family RNA polymerase sigma factor n=1 Tax=Mucilaginibacter myungsuensis TaxID=649104 RepID=A0A929L1R7_9SPHI|nr:sigma-70 family RNA polymerase sigma factor [Mucilaginibacter myungsuensis]MBE9664543.1 sigma-70 family RNA polymerase sigma factor [Mucilaginibacter myungsuensis]MDN3601107.1 sigma-70 family RNA polymerase sigma factor [Mucilaginibacter myungsuensis]
MHPPASVAETELIGHCKQGSLKHQEMLYKHYYGFAMGVALRYCLTRDHALEAVNDAFIKVFNGIGNYNTDRPFKAWLRTIIVNTAIDSRRRELKHQLTTDLDDAAPIRSGTFIIENINAQDILKLLDALPAIQRTVFNMYEIDGYSHDEISAELNIPASSARVYLARAKEKLRKLIVAI